MTAADPLPAAPVRWGILSTSDFAARRFIPALRRSPHVEVVAVASRDLARARAYAEANSIPTAYGSYDELLADPSVEVVYNPLPNTAHVEWTRRAAEAGKHVLCEKPMGINADEVATLLPVATRVHIAEGFMVRHHPQWDEVRQLVRSGRLGRLTHAHVEFNYHNADPANIRNDASVGGGAMYDIGCYAVVAARFFFDAEPRRVVATMDRDPVFGTDRLTSGIFAFAGGLTCTFSVSTQSVPHQRVHLFGTNGRAEVTIPFNHPHDEPVIYLTHHATTLAGLDAEQHVVEAADQYRLEAEWFSRLVRQSQPDDLALRDAITNMRIIDAVFASAASGTFITI